MIRRCLLMLFVLCSICTGAQERFEVFVSPSPVEPHYRIPAMASLADGTVICVADYRYSLRDVGIVKDGRIDLCTRVSRDNGKTWGEIETIVEGKGKESPDFMNVAFGDPAIVADRKSGRVLLVSCAGNISYPKGTRDCHLCMVRFYSEDGGLTWSSPEDMSEDIYALFDDSRYGPAQSMFIASGKIVQSRYVKAGRYYRLYCALLLTTARKERVNYVIYSDDFGQTWDVLGGPDVCVINAVADEAKVEELPDGSVLISSRYRKGGRRFNVFTYENRKKAVGTWSEAVHSSAHNNGIVTEKNDCNGEVMVLPVKRNDGRAMYLLLQSAPMGPGRTNVGIYYKPLPSKGTLSPEDIAKDWEGVFRVTDKGSAYSTMAMLSDGALGFLYEENTYYPKDSMGYTIVFDRYTIEQITGGKYVPDIKKQH